MLVLIGLGLYDQNDITLRGLEEARGSDRIYAEFYTSFMPGFGIEKLEELVGREVKLLSRGEVEGEAMVKEAEDSRVSLLVGGDPLISTTHMHLLLEARKRGIGIKVVNNASIVSTAPALAGLQNYKFGRSASIVTPEKGFFPLTPYRAVRENLERGLHTMLFLDIRVEGDEVKMMSAREGLKHLLEMEGEEKEGVITPDTTAIVVSQGGAPEFRLSKGSIAELLEKDLGSPPQTIIIPGELHFLEEEYLEVFGE